MLIENFPTSETITAIVTGLVTWFGAGRFTKQSIEIQNAQLVLKMWQETATHQKVEIQQMKEEMRQMVKRIDELENHIIRLETENKVLKSQLQQL